MRQTHLLSLLRGHRIKRLLVRALDEAEFLSDYGIRSLSKYHQNHPVRLHLAGRDFTLRYEPGELETDLFGGNSNWRGPIWFPTNFLLIESLQRFHHYYGNDFKVEYPTRSGQLRTLLEIADALSGRLTRLFLRNPAGVRPALGLHKQLQNDPHFRHHLLSSTNTSTATPAGASGPATKPAGPASSPSYCSPAPEPDFGPKSGDCISKPPLGLEQFRFLCAALKGER